MSDSKPDDVENMAAPDDSKYKFPELTAANIPSPELNISPVAPRSSLGELSANGSWRFTDPRLRPPPESPTKTFVHPKDTWETPPPSPVKKLYFPTAAPRPFRTDEETQKWYRGGGKSKGRYLLVPKFPRYLMSDDEDEAEEDGSEGEEEGHSSDDEGVQITATPTNEEDSDDQEEEEEFDDGDHESDDDFVPARSVKKATRKEESEDEDGSGDESDGVRPVKKPTKARAARKPRATKPTTQKKKQPKSAQKAPAIQNNYEASTSGSRKTIKRSMSVASLSGSDEVDVKKQCVHAPDDTDTAGASTSDVGNTQSVEQTASTTSTSAIPSGSVTSSITKEVVWSFMPADSPDRILNINTGIKITANVIKAVEEHFASGGDTQMIKPTPKCPNVPTFELDAVDVPKVSGQKTYLLKSAELYLAVSRLPMLSIRALEQGHLGLLFHRKRVDKKWLCPHCGEEAEGKSVLNHFEKGCAWILESEHLAAEANSRME